VGQVVRFTSPGVAEVVSEDRVVPGSDEVLVKTAYSGISAGTELTAYRGSNPYMSSEWDADRRLFRPGATTLAYPLDGWGYEEVGRVGAVGSSADADLVGRLVWGAWGHRSHAVRPTRYVRDRLLPDDSRPLPGIFAKIGAIALNAVLDADIHVGETVAVFGAGVPGQIVAQLARLNGARVVVVDRMQPRLELAARLGAAEVLEPSAVDVSLAIRDLTENRGADVVIEMSGAYQALQEAVRAAAYSSRVVASGFFQGPGTPLRLGEEFHHNRISVVSSQISGVAPHLQHRWDELRMSTTVLELERQGRLALTELVTHVVDADEAPSAFAMLASTPQDALQVVLDYGTSS
jgi:2-desacetyl-2-hydroxyethyl bacteriochlorophyllide A dehydrogenase